MTRKPEAAAPGQDWRVLARAVLQEPLTHFLAIGVVLMLAAAGLKALERPVLKVDAGEISQLVAYWQVQTQRAPTPEELQGIIRERVDEEILAREAIRLGLDQDDLIIRRRLAQKMAFAGEDISPVAEPDEAALRERFRRNPDQYASPPLLTFRHVFFSDDRAGGGGRVAAETVLLSGAVDSATGDPFVLPRSYRQVRGSDLLRDYGPDFIEAALTAPLGQWTGPVRSAYGWHLVRVETRQKGGPADFETVKAQVRDDYLEAARDNANAAFMDQLRARYVIEVAEAPAGKP